jgi:hypothetical protein
LEGGDFVEIFSIDGALKNCRDCKHEVINCYKEDDKGNTIRLPENYKPLTSESGIFLEPVTIGSSCDVVSKDYRRMSKDHTFSGCPFFEKK